MAEVKFYATLNTQQLDKQIKTSTQKVGAYTKRVNTLSGAMDNAFKGVALRLVSYGAIFAGLNLVRAIVEVRGEFQKLQIAFETMLDSKKKADEIMAQSIDLAQKTPFTLMEVTTNAKQLMAMGVAYKDVMGTLKNLGDVAAGVSVPLSRIAINYGQVLTLGRLQAREIRDFAMAGVPLVAELAKNMEKSKSEIMGLVKAGQIGAVEVTKAFQTMAGVGGKFYNLMEKQNASVTGQISNLVDKWQVMLNEIGTNSEGAIYGTINALGVLVKNYEEVGKILLTLVQTYGVYRAALIVTNSIQRTSLIAIYTTEAAALNNLITVEQRAKISKMGLTVGTTEHITAIRAEAVAEMNRQTQIAVALNKESASRLMLLQVRREGLATAIAEQRAAALHLASATKIGNKELINSAVKTHSTAVQNTNTASTLKNAAAKDFYSKKAVIDSAVRRANTIETGLNTVSQQANLTWTNFLTAAKTRLTSAVVRLNAAILANPWTIIAAGVAALAFGIYKLSTATSNQTIAQEELNDALQETKDKQDALINDSESLLRVIRSETSSNYERVKSYNELIKKYEYFRDFSLSEIRGLSGDEFSQFFSDFKFGSEKGAIEANIDTVRKELEVLRKSYDEIVSPIVLRGILRDIEIAEIKLKGFGEELKKILDAEKEADILSLDTDKRLEYYKNEIELLKERKKILEDSATIIPNPFESKRPDEFTSDSAGADIFLQKIKQEITEFEKLIRELEDSNRKDVDEKKLKFEEKLGQKRIDNALRVRQTLINIEEDGVDKRIKQAKLNFDKEVANIEKERQKLLSDAKKAKTTVSEEDLKLFDARIVTAEINKANVINKIYSDASEERLQILKDANQVFLDENEKEIEAINEKYDGEKKRLTELKATKEQFTELEKARVAEIELVNQKTSLKLSKFYQKIYSDVAIMGDKTLKDLVDKAEDIVSAATESTTDGKDIDITIPIVDQDGNHLNKIIPLTAAEFVNFKNKVIDLRKETDKRNPFEALGDALWDLNAATLLDDKEGIAAAFESIIISAENAEVVINKWGDSLDNIFAGAGIGKAIKNMTSLAVGAANFAKALATGSVIDGITAGLGILESFVSLFDSSARKEAERQQRAENLNQILEIQNRKLERQIELLNTISGIDRTMGEQAVLDEIQRQMDALNKRADEAIFDLGGNIDDFYASAFSGILSQIFDIDDIAELRAALESENFQELLDMGITIENLDELTALIDEYDALIGKREELLEQLAQTSSNAIADAIAEGFAAGETSEEDFANNFEKLMKDAIIESFKTQFLLEASRGFFDKFTELASGGLTLEEVESLQEAWSVLQSGALQQWNSLIEGMYQLGIDFTQDQDTSSQGLSGAIRRELTEETGTELLGLFRRNADDTRVIKDTTKTGITHLIGIEKNTFDTVTRLDSVIVKLDAIKVNTKDKYTGLI